MSEPSLQSATLDAAKMQDVRSRKPFVWAPPSKEDEFNLTELIDSVERKVPYLNDVCSPLPLSTYLTLTYRVPVLG